MGRRGSGARCTYCKRVMESKWSRGNLAETRDHYEPECRGGKVKVPECRFCNGVKADLSPEIWNRVMAMHPEWWRKINHDAVRATVKKFRASAVNTGLI